MVVLGYSKISKEITKNSSAIFRITGTEFDSIEDI